MKSRYLNILIAALIVFSLGFAPFIIFIISVFMLNISVFWAIILFIPCVLFIISDSASIIFFNANPRNFFAKYVRIFLESIKGKCLNNQFGKVTGNAKIIIIYKRNIFTYTRFLSIGLDDAKWPFVYFIRKEPLILEVTEGQHSISLTDGYPDHRRKYDILTSEQYETVIIFHTRNIFILERPGRVEIKYNMLT